MKSCIYHGRLRHRRSAPVENHFDYSLFMLFLDLNELQDVFKGRLFWSAHRPTLAWFCRKDYLGDPQVPLDQAVRDLVERDTGNRPIGPIRMLTHLRYFGHCFNPVTMYYCYDLDDRQVQTIVAQITNTPWKERHAYVLEEKNSLSDGHVKRFRFRKTFHVSPFMSMDLTYDWQFCEPSNHLTIHMANLDLGKKIFDSTLTLQREEISTATLARCLLQYPMITAKILVAIHYQALKLWLKKCPFYAHSATVNVGKESSSHA